MSYAQNTSTPIERTKGEIEKTLKRYGATGFANGWEGDVVTVMFILRGRHIRFDVQLWDPEDPRFTLTPSGRYQRSAAEATKAYEQAVRQRWRALLLIIKAKLEAVDAGITTIEDEFLPQTVLPTGSTVSRWLQPQITRALESSAMPALLPGDTP